MHPSDEIRGIKSKNLSNKRIVLGVTGSIAAVETIQLSRELIRHGADVYPVMTKAATEIIHPYSLEFATGKKPVIDITGKTEHVSFLGRVKKPADLLLVSPCTANTISKIARGIDDTSVTTYATTAIGSGIPVLIVPAMHLSMYDHKIVQENIEKCKKIGIKFVDPFIEKNKAKMPDIDEIVANVIKNIGRRDLLDKKILVIGGSTAESIDDVRTVVTRSSGKTAVWLAKNSYYRGADVVLWYGWNRKLLPYYIKSERFESIDQLIKMVESKDLSSFDIIIICAALADYTPKKIKGKISSGKDKLVLELTPTPKIISKLRKLAPKSIIVGFKMEENIDKIQEKAFELLKKNNLDLVVANTISAFNRDNNEIWIINKKGNSIHKKGNKENLADHILDALQIKK
jgi:phosphopantothenoylcysteine decarboxylase/phosphopantothenate--cysteine ligase